MSTFSPYVCALEGGAGKESGALGTKRAINIFGIGNWGIRFDIFATQEFSKNGYGALGMFAEE